MPDLSPTSPEHAALGLLAEYGDTLAVELMYGPAADPVTTGDAADCIRYAGAARRENAACRADTLALSVTPATAQMYADTAHMLRRVYTPQTRVTA